MLNWAKQFNIFCFLDNRQYNFTAPAFECLLGAGSKRRIELPAGNAFQALKQFCNKENNEWLFGHFGYDLKNETEQLHPIKKSAQGFADMHFYVPQIIVRLTEKQVTIITEEDAAVIMDQIESLPPFIEPLISREVFIKNRISKEEYLLTIAKLKKHIHLGDCYEINFCQEFFAEFIKIEPVAMYQRLLQESPNPFAALYKVNDNYCLCASPERFLKKTGNKLISQPIKGTSKRDLADEEQDRKNREYLFSSSKEKSENVMVVDLVRNDLSRICEEGTVKVDELFGVYSFPQVHQLISTISGELKEGLHWVDAIKETFPMGSMTGAPKKKVMELIGAYEQSNRGLFSGSIGYVNPEGDFDFNVVIRSIFYNTSTLYLSFQTGSGITFNSDPEKEYEECLWKAAAMQTILR